MQRQIKFRFRLKLIVDKWGTYKKGDIDTFIIPLLGDKNGLVRWGIDKQWEIVSCDEFMGLYDNNNTPIYEGDIIADINRELEDNIYVCEYIEKEARYYFTSPLDGEVLDENDFSSDMVIIGNIYENKDLLK